MTDTIAAHTASLSWAEQTRPQRVDALMWVAERAHILADAYAVRIGASWQGPEVTLQGEFRALARLVQMFDAIPDASNRSESYRCWVATVDGVTVHMIEEAAK